ncbi:MAG: ABC transporter ATP-binding protein [Ruminiclostridium sp.]
MELINLTDIDKSYGTNQKVLALKKLTLSIGEGELVAVMGKSGSGKSTMLNILAGIDRFDSGNYFFEGRDMSVVKGDELTTFRRKNIGFVVQHFALIEDYTVYDNISLILRYEKVTKREIEKRITNIVAELDIQDKLQKYPRELSGGQAQRVAIARAIINKPRLLLADEPTGALDEETGNDIMELFKELNQQGMTIIIVTHDLKVASMCNQIIQIKDGKFVNKIEKSYFIRKEEVL